jgi:hypothetical protein
VNDWPPGIIDLSPEGHHTTHERGGVDEIRGLASVGFACWWWGTLANIPYGWKLADGSFNMPDGTTPPDMRNRMPIGAGTTYALGATGGSAAFTHAANGAFTHSSYVHLHTQNLAAVMALGGFGVVNANTNNDGGHTHDAHPTHTHDAHALPPYGAWYFIVRVF